MPEPHVTLTPSAPEPADAGSDRSPERLGAALRAAVERVRAGYAGEPVEEVCRRLLDETRAGLSPAAAATFVPDMDEFCRLSVAIVRYDIRP